MSEEVTQTVTDVGVGNQPVHDAEQWQDPGTVARLCRSDRGMVSAEWAVGLIAAIAIAGVLLAVVTTGTVKTALLDFILMVIRAFARGL